MPFRSPRCQLLLLSTAIALACLLGSGGRVAAHPLDRLVQHVVVHLDAHTAHFSVAVGGGMLANEEVLADLDQNRDRVVDETERRAWVGRWLREARLTLDGQVVVVDPASVRLDVPVLSEFHVGLAPLLISFDLSVSTQTADHRISLRNDYRLDRTDFRLDVAAGSGAAVIDQSWPGRTMRIAFRTDPALAEEQAPPVTAADAWSGNRIVQEARDAIEHPRTPGFLAVMFAIFAAMGALHALQPGHGKALVAAYLVATGGTPRDAFVLAGIVTCTHTISVFAIGIATLAASEFFLPARVIPVMSALSGLLVAAMGIAMLYGAVKRRRAAPGRVGHHHEHPQVHDHATLTDEEHARLHLEGAMAFRRGVPRRNLVALGITGGLAPCPDAIAILLLAIGMGQAGIGLLAIVAFSLGLAGVLVAFGLAIALAGPVWSRLRLAPGQRTGWTWPVGRLVVYSPLVSAAVVLALGLAMAWRALPA